MDDRELDSWLIHSRNAYVSIQTALEASEKPNEEMQDQRANVFSQMEQYLEYNSSIHDLDVAFHLSILSALVKYELGKIYFWGYPALAEKYFTDAWNLVKAHYTDPDYVLLAVCIIHELNAMAIRKKVCAKEANDYFIMSQHVWNSYKCKTEEHALALENLFLSKPFRETVRGSLSFDPVYNLHKVGRQRYSDSLVRNLLVAANEIFKNYDEPFEWLRTLYRLADMFLESQRFSAARYILSCANVMVIEDEIILRRCILNDEMLKKCEHVKAKLDEYWGCYAMSLLSFSQNMKQRGETGIASSSSNPSIILQQERIERIARLEAKAPGTLASNYEEAMQILSFGKTHLERAQSYYLQTKLMGDYVSTIEVINHLYESVIYFDDDDDRKYKTHGEITDAMIPQLDIVDSATHPESNKRVLFQMSQWYIRHLCLIVPPCRAGAVNTDDLAKKISDVCAELITCSSLLLNHYPHDDILPDDYSFDDARYALQACVAMSCARAIYLLYKSNALADLQTVEEYASKVVFYISKHPEHACFVNSVLTTLKDSAEKIQEFVSSLNQGTQKVCLENP